MSEIGSEIGGISPEQNPNKLFQRVRKFAEERGREGKEKIETGLFMAISGLGMSGVAEKPSVSSSVENLALSYGPLLLSGLFGYLSGSSRIKVGVIIGTAALGLFTVGVTNNPDAMMIPVQVAIGIGAGSMVRAASPHPIGGSR